MSYRTILFHAEPPPHSQARARCVIDLADRFGATLVGLAAEAIPPLEATDPYGLMAPTWVEAMRDNQEAHLIAAEAEFRRQAGARPVEWRSVLGRPTDALHEAARAADLIVVAGGSPAHPHGFRTVDRGELVLRSGRPVLCAPSNADYLSAQNILVCWKDCREARRALHDAMPLLARANDVLLLSVAEGAPAAIADDVCAALKRHGVKARAEAAQEDSRVSDTILHRAFRVGADLIVAGAYGHTRLGERIFGGATRDLLDQDQSFVLFSH